ncbi:MAG: ABC transporter permease [Candidatus Thermoplasmatota archaeon]|jgi:ABC-2 type transport system permease protein|nr:ABC transporter permease [Candidatus Thermoplasmatota archaeon]MCL5790019.1 ABC transporter permease [Candidatus Thermoplasmatota archaeon]
MNSIIRLTYRIIRSALDINTISFLVLLPVGYLLIMGLMMGSIIHSFSYNGINLSYVSFIAPGVVADQILMGGSMAGWVLWSDKRTGMLEQIFSMPFSRFEYQLSNLLAMILVTFGGALIMILVAIPFISLRITAVGFLFVFIYLVLGTLTFGSIMLALGATVRSNQVFNVISNVMFFVVTFTSSVFYPITSQTPRPLAMAARLNPLTYVVDGIRNAFLNASSTLDIYYVGILIVTSTIFMAIASYTYKRIRLSATV